MLPFPGGTVLTAGANFGPVPCGPARLAHRRRPRRRARIAGRLYRLPGGTPPAKPHQPQDDKARGRLMNRPELTPAAVRGPHGQHAPGPVRQPGPGVLILHDTTELDYAGLRAIPAPGPTGGGRDRG